MAVFYFLLSTKIADHWWCHIGYPFLKTWIEWNHSALMAMFVFLIIQSVYYLLNIILVPASLHYDQCCQIKLVLFFVLYFQQWVLVPSLYFTVLSYSQISLPCIKFSLLTSPFPWQNWSRCCTCKFLQQCHGNIPRCPQFWCKCDNYKFAPEASDSDKMVTGNC